MAKDKKIKKNKLKTEGPGKLSNPWTEEKITRIKAFLEKESKKKMPEKDQKTALLSIRFRMEYYLLTNNAEIEKIRPIEEFLAAMLKALDIPFKLFAVSIDCTDANLKKYLGGQRKFNAGLAMKFGSFFQVPPELWLNIQAKNEILQIQSNPQTSLDYARFDYENIFRTNK